MKILLLFDKNRTDFLRIGLLTLPYIRLFKRLFFLTNILVSYVNPLNAELNPICHLLALLGAHHILHVSRVRVKHYLSYVSCK